MFEGFPIPIAGKTGTAEKGAGRADQSWYVALAPYPDPKYVVAVTDEAGGFGADTAAPMARPILAELFNVDETGWWRGRRAAPSGLMSADHPRHPVQDFRARAASRALLRLDPLLLLATLGLIAASVYTARRATPGRHPGRPRTTTCTARSLYAASGC